MSADAQIAIEVRHLSKSFVGGSWGRRHEVRAVSDVSFSVATGTTLALVGESGSGKTTTARIVAGLDRADAGEVLLFGTAQARSRAARRAGARDVQMVFQNPYRSLDPRQPVRGAIDEFLRVHTDLTTDRRARRADELLDLVGLPARVANALPRDLSGGQRQRVCIARALAVEPRVIVLDEAVAALDVSVQAQVLNVLADVRDNTGVTYLFVTHDLAVVRQIADDVVVMRTGEIVESGTAAQVLDAPQDPYTKLLRDSVPRVGWVPRRRA